MNMAHRITRLPREELVLVPIPNLFVALFFPKVSHTLLRVLRHCMDSKNIDRNLHLVYALVYHQSDFNVIASKKRKCHLSW